MTKVDQAVRAAADQAAKAMSTKELVQWARQEAGYWREAAVSAANPQYLAAAARLDALANALEIARQRVMLLEHACIQLRYGDAQN
jgi:hypothetical protein